MTALIVDALIALTRLVDRGCVAVEMNVRHRATPQPVADAQPAGAGVSLPASATGAGGHPTRNTSDVLTEAAVRLENAYCLIQAMQESGARIPAWALGIPAATEAIAPELRDHAAQLAIHGL